MRSSGFLSSQWPREVARNLKFVMEVLFNSILFGHLDKQQTVNLTLVVQIIHY